MERKSQQETCAKAQEIWDSMDANERHGVRFGMFPAAKMQAADKEGYGNELSIALIDIASKNGGMRA